MRQLNPETYYLVPTYLNWTITPNVQSNTTGTFNNQGGRVTTTHKIFSFVLKITYTGPANIGDRTLSETNIRNYWEDYHIKQLATQESDTGCCTPNDDDDVPTCCIITGFIFVLTIPWAIYYACQKPRHPKYAVALNKFASQAMSREIANLLQSADEQVKQRIAYVHPSSVPTRPAQAQPQQRPPAPGSDDPRQPLLAS